MKILFFYLCVGLFVSNISFAETIVLKSGKTVEGKITNRTNEYTEIDFMGVKLKYLNDQIEQIKEEKSVSGKGTTAVEPELITIKIKGSGSTNTAKGEGIKDFLDKLDNINNKIDSIISERMSKIPREKGQKVTKEEQESMKSAVSMVKARADEIEKMKAPAGCKVLKDLFMQLSRIRIGTLEQLINNVSDQIATAKILEKSNTEIAEASKKYTDERQRVLKQFGDK